MTTHESDVAVEDVMALSPLQQGLYSRAVLGEADGDVDPYVITMSADISGPLDVTLLRDCAEAMLVRHPNLRVSFLHRDLPHPVQIVPSRAKPRWRHVGASAEQLPKLEADERSRRFDLERGPLIRFLLAELGGQQWRLVITAHHIVLDGWSLPVLTSELVALYAAGGDTSSLGPAPRPYRDYIGWLSDRDHDRSAQLWRDYLADLPGPTFLSQSLALDQPHGLPRRVDIEVGTERTARLVEAARSRGLTVNTVLQVAWAMVLARFTDRDDVVFGVTVSGRPAELASVESMVGLFINTVPLRVRLDSAVTVGQLCSDVQQSAARLRDHGYLTHARLRALGGVGEMFDTLLVFENFPPGALVGAEEFSAGAVTFRPAALESLAHFPVTVAAHLLDARLTVLVETVDNALGLGDPHALGDRLLATMERLVGDWDQRVGDIDVLLPGEAAEGEDPASAVAVTGGFSDRFASSVAARPDAIALAWSGGRMSYRQLADTVDDVAAALAEQGVGPEVPVAVRLPRGPDYVIAMLAILRAGGVCVPLEIDTPDHRIRSILHQTGATTTLTGRLPVAAPTAEFRAPTAHPEQAAYVVFTSGTTGEPKGVVGTHRALLAYSDDHVGKVLGPASRRLGRPLRIAHAWSFAFDAAWQPLAALLDGHEVHIVDERDRRDAEALTRLIVEQQIDVIDTTPSMLGQLRACGLLGGTPLAVLALGGEAVGPDTWADVADVCSRTGMEAVNCYGPTETTVEAVVAVIADYARPMIGHPTGGTSVQVLDSRLRRTPDGVVGELYVAGEQLTRGYLCRPGETAIRYVAADNGTRMYRTGDLVRRHPGGALEFVGRVDSQVKIRGYRVEPKEIEAALVSHPAVRQAHVLVDRSQPRARLIAFAAGDAPIAELRTALRNRLPRFMIPHRIVVVDEIALTANGKPDEAALRAAIPESAYDAAPATGTERLLASVFTELLGVSRVDVDIDVLELGLDSITAVSAVQAARRRGIPLQARMIAEYGTVRELAAAVDAATVVEPAAQRGGPSAVLPVLRWLYEYGDPRRLGQTYVLRLPRGADAVSLRAALDAVVAGHPVMRSRLDRATMSLVDDGPVGWPLREVETDDESSAVTRVVAEAIDALDPERGRVVSAAWIHRHGEPGVLALTAHVIALDPVSWRVVLAELEAGWHATADGHEPAKLTERTGYRHWVDLLAARARALDTLWFWTDQLDGDDPVLGSRRVNPATDRAGDLALSATIADADVTAALLDAGLPLHHVLLAATARCVSSWRRHRNQVQTPPVIAVEAHGRADAVLDGADTSETVGLLTAIYPLRFDARGTVDDVAARLDSVPGDGIDYGLLRHMRDDTAAQLAGRPEPQVLLNFLGRMDLDNAGRLVVDRELSLASPLVPEPNLAVRHELTLIAAVMRFDGRPRLAVQWRSLPEILTESEIVELQAFWDDSLRALATEVIE